MVKRLETNLNVDPYYDDYDPDKRFYKILFRPAVAVQARELTQIQDILQEQVRLFANYQFKDGTVIDGCAITYMPNLDYVHVKNWFNNDPSRDIFDIQTSYLLTNSQDSTDAVRAVPVIVKQGFENQYPETNRIYLKYIASGRDASGNQVDTFQPGDTIYVYNDLQNKLGTLDPANLIDSIDVMAADATVTPIGKAYGVSVTDGIVYQKGFFQRVNEHVTLVNPFSNDPTGYVVGFETSEYIITPEADFSLYDNAAGYSNYAAPGAHRLQLEPKLVAKLKTELGPDSDFFAIIEFDAEMPTEQNTGEESLNIMRDVMAKRTYEESGNYVIKPFAVETVPHESDPNLFTYEISPGIVYVNGYRVEKLNTYRIDTDRATKTDEALSELISANYGNYILVNEYAGTFDFRSMERVALYDAVQSALSSSNGTTPSPSGNIIGYANVRLVKWDGGRKGVYDTRYRLYLTNISMNAGHSFSEVKSIVGAQGRADLVSSELIDASRNTLVFDFGVDAVKRLRDKNGNINNTYVLRDSTSATLGVDGIVTFTLNTPPNGGTERINFGVGVLSDTNEVEEFEVILSSELYTANLVGTVDLSGTTTITGTGTTFTQHFEPGDYIYVIGDTGNFVRRVVSVTSDTSLTIDADINDTATAASYKKYYPAGHVVDLSRSGATIEVLSDTQFKVTTGLDLGAGSLEPGTQSVTAYYPVQRSQSVEAKKIIKKNRFVKIDLSSHPNGTTGPWSLGVTDLHKIRGIYVGNTYDVNNPDRKDWFVIDNGQRDDVYDIASISVKPAYKDKITSSTLILVELDYFDVDTTAGRGFFAIDSYPINDADPTSATSIATAEVPLFRSGLNGNVYDLRNCVDFRYRFANTAADATTEASATVNPAFANKTTIDVPNPVHIIAVDETFQADMEYYLPRIDLICMDKNGNIVIRQGNSDINPVEPKNEVDTIVLARSDIAPYPSLTTRENEIYKRLDMTTKTRFRAIKRYTMKDIDALEKRISRMEYYTTLNLLEQKAKDMVIPDENGLDRFKNGIFADSFNSHLGGKTNDIEYSIAIDKDKGIARPIFKSRPIDLKADLLNSSGIRKTGHYLLLDYTDEKFIEQKYATKYRNCTANMWHWNGNIKLYPSYDHFRDERFTPAVNAELDLTSAWEEFANSPFASNFGNWRVVSRNVQRERNGNTITTRRTTTSERVIEGLNVETTTETFDLGTYVNDFSISPYMRSRLIAIVVEGLKPSTRMHVFFDGKNVDEHCTPAVFSGKTDVEAGKEHEILTATGQYGDPIYTDANGQFLAIFRIPDQTFRVGDRPLVVTNVDNLETGADAQIASAQAVFTASNISVTKNDLTLTTYNPDITSFRTTEQRVEISERTINIPPQTDNSDLFPTVWNRDSDPIAQTFKIIPPQPNISGLFISQLGVYFRKKDANLGCSVYIAEVNNGYPDGSRVIGKGHLDSASIQVSNDSSAETVFILENPVFLNANKEYAFIVHPDGNSPEYEIWCSEIGDFDIITNEQVFSNPYSGILYVSANMLGWTALQGEDLKFNIYRCKFTSNAGTAKFENEDDDYILTDGFVNNGTERVKVGDHVYKSVAGTLITDPNSADYAFGTVQFIDEGENILVIDGSNGNFNAGDAIEIHRPNNGIVDATTLIASTNIVTIENPEIHVVVPRFGDMMPALTNIEYRFGGSDSVGIPEAAYIKVTNDYDTELLDKPRFVHSKSNETNGKTIHFEAVMKSYSEYLSPVIDLRRKSFLAIENLINNDSTNEHLRTGNAKTKYVSLNVTLDSNLGPAEDMRAYVGAYRPAGTDIEVYVKVQGADDGDPFDDKLWTKMEMTSGSKGLFSAPFDTEDYREFEFRMPAEILAQVGNKTTAYLNSNGVVEYVREDGAVIVGYQIFSFKIVLKAESGHRVPRLNDFRAISLQA